MGFKPLERAGALSLFEALSALVRISPACYATQARQHVGRSQQAASEPPKTSASNGRVEWTVEEIQDLSAGELHDAVQGAAVADGRAPVTLMVPVVAVDKQGGQLRPFEPFEISLGRLWVREPSAAKRVVRRSRETAPRHNPKVWRCQAAAREAGEPTSDEHALQLVQNSMQRAARDIRRLPDGPRRLVIGCSLIRRGWDRLRSVQERDEQVDQQHHCN
jgi:hypothetical protein